MYYASARGCGSLAREVSVHRVSVLPTALRRSKAAGNRLPDQPPALRLTDDEVAFFHREGYLSIPRLTTPDEVAWIMEVCDLLFSSRRGWGQGDLFDFAGTDEPGRPWTMPQLLRPSKYERALATTLYRRNATTIARQLLNPTARVLFEHMLLKSAVTGCATPWHQDQAFWAAGAKHETLTVWMPLQDVDLTNGCMQFVPESHLLKLVSHRSLNDDPRVHALEAIDVDTSAAVACPLAAGGANVHHYRTLHGCGPNTTSNPRRAYALLFGVRSNEVRIREDYPWNACKQTERQDRYLATRTPTQRLLDTAKACASRWL